MSKDEDCIYCICIECKEEFKTDVVNCEHSDCKWCVEEEGRYTTNCGIYISKGGNYFE